MHHPFGRLGEPWASSRLIATLVCFNDHERVHRPALSVDGRAVRDLLRLQACERLRAWLARQVSHTVTVFPYDVEKDTPRSYFAYLTTVADLNHIAPPGWDKIEHTGGPNHGDSTRSDSSS